MSSNYCNKAVMFSAATITNEENNNFNSKLIVTNYEDSI